MLPDEVLSVLDPQPGETYVDGTAGLGGHAAMVGERLGGDGTVVLNDLDGTHLDRAAEIVRASGVGRVETVKGNFAELPRWMERAGLGADLVLADLGFSSAQMDEGERGLSFRKDGPLDMRLDPGGEVTAGELVNTWPEGELAEVIFRYGEEKRSRVIARKIVAARAEGPILTTQRLAEIVREAFPPGPSRLHPATKTFQALRIAVNDELGSLERLLRGIEGATDRIARGEPGWIRAGGRVALISFHSLEDRLVKRSFAGLADRGVVELLTRGPVTPSESEASRNPRSRSAKLRAVRLLGQDGRDRIG